MKRRMRLEIVATGKVLDTVTLNGDKVSYSTGKAKNMFASAIIRVETEKAAFEELSEWSNGYLRFVPVND